MSDRPASDPVVPAKGAEVDAGLQPRRRETGHGLYALLGIGRNDGAARDRQMRRNFEFFGAPTVIFLFAHKGLREFSVLDAGIYLQTVNRYNPGRGETEKLRL